MIRRCGWLDIEAIGKRLLETDRISANVWYYLKMSLTGECDRNARFCLIDEVQDYTAAQLMILQKYFVNAHFMLLGDEFQSIRPGTVTFAQIHDLFGQNKADVKEMQLTTSYRSSPEITQLFASLLPAERRIQVDSVQRPGLEPVIRVCESRSSYRAALQEAIDHADNHQGLTAILCSDARSLDRISALLSDRNLPVIRHGDALPESGIFLIELQYAKGLEFDKVILPDADETHYPDTGLSRHRLYTAISRATGEITILAEGTLTHLLLHECSTSEFH